MDGVLAPSVSQRSVVMQPVLGLGCGCRSGSVGNIACQAPVELHRRSRSEAAAGEVADFWSGLRYGVVKQLGRREGRKIREVWRSVVCERTTVSSDDFYGTKRGGSQRSNESRHSHLSSALSTLPVAYSSDEAECIQNWRLDDAIMELRDLQKQLLACQSVREKVAVVERSRRVSSVFGAFGSHGVYVGSAITLAMRVFGEHELYLLKCLVASGQEHVLEWSYMREENNEESRLKDEVFPLPAPGNFVKEVFSFLGSAITSWEESHGNLLAGLSSFTIQKRHPCTTAKQAKSLEFADGKVNVSEDGLMHSLIKLVKILERLENFYDSIGGIVGYQMTALELIRASEIQAELRQSESRYSAKLPGPSKKYFSVPLGPDLGRDQAYAMQAASWGLEGLPEMGEIYPVGGAGDRLGLCDDTTGECLPVAMLPYCGRTLLEGLVRDLQAREFLHFKVYGKQHITPVAIMTSAAKRNDQRVRELCKKLGWFGRGKQNFKLFEQPLVPAVAVADGRWLVSGPLTTVLKPGGHGAIWKLAHDEGIFKWFYRNGRKAVIVRQISNTVAATDLTLLALSGIGLQHNKKFGFASCERNVGTAEGVNVLMEISGKDSSWECAVTCIEYTEFEKLGVHDVSIAPGSKQASYPANTNVLYVDLASVEQVASSSSAAALPGMIMNLKKPVTYTDSHGFHHSVSAGRIECTMQSITQSLVTKSVSRLSSKDHGLLDTFVIYNERRKVTSSAKRRRKEGEHSLHQTPDGSFLDMTRNGRDLLTSCGVCMPEVTSNQYYVDSGPPFLILIHPALGPLWDIVRQKICRGSVAGGSELVLEISEFSWKDVQIEGSMLIQATNIMGSLVYDENGEAILKYGSGCGKCLLNNVTVKNKGIDWICADNVYWKHEVQRFEALNIFLEGDAEFEAHNVTLEGSHNFHVPKGHRMIISSTNSACWKFMEAIVH